MSCRLVLYSYTFKNVILYTPTAEILGDVTIYNGSTIILGDMN